MRSSFIFLRSSYPAPMRLSAPGRKFWTNTSALAMRRSKASLPLFVLRLSTIDCLPPDVYLVRYRA